MEPSVNIGSFRGGRGGDNDKRQMLVVEKLGTTGIMV
jgi:hypothetical protein